MLCWDVSSNKFNVVTHLQAMKLFKDMEVCFSRMRSRISSAVPLCWELCFFRVRDLTLLCESSLTLHSHRSLVMTHSRIYNAVSTHNVQPSQIRDSFGMSHKHITTTANSRTSVLYIRQTSRRDCTGKRGSSEKLAFRDRTAVRTRFGSICYLCRVLHECSSYFTHWYRVSRIEASCRQV